MRWLPPALILFLLPLAVPAAADVSLTIEDLIARHREYRLDINMTYLSQQRDENDVFYEYFQIGEGDFILLPVDIARGSVNRDVFALALSLRRGISPDTEVYATLVADYTDTREQYDGGRGTDTNARFTELSFGASHEFVKEGRWPGVLGYGELTLLENQASEGTRLAHAENMQVGATVHRTYDPVVISLSAGYLYNGSRRHNASRHNPGDILYMTPGLSFAINNDLSLNAGLYYRLHRPGRWNGRSFGVRYSEMQFGMGVSSSRSDRLTLRMDGRFSISGTARASISFEVSYSIPTAASERADNANN